MATHLPTLTPLPVANAAEAPCLSLVIPTLREVKNLPVLLGRIQTALAPMNKPYEILVVDDDSRDGTEELLARLSAEDPRLRLLVRKGQRGLSGAILYGWLHARSEILGVMDADLQHPPEILPQLLTAILDGHDIAIGSRYTQGGSLHDWNRMRRFLSTAATSLTWPIQHRGARAKDPMAGFFLVRRSCITGIPFQPAGFKLLLEVLVRGRLRSLAEVPIAFGLREQGDSKASLKVGWDYALLLLHLYLDRFLFFRNRSVGA